MKTFNDDPNFSIVMPGGCNAKCAFCFNHTQPKFPTVNLGTWMANLIQQLSTVGSQFYQVSITGGEPMLSPYIDNVFSVLATMRKKYTNILITTNGTNLLDKIDMVKIAVDHINISRHHYDENENKKIFGGTYNVTDANLEDIVDEYGKLGIDVSVNCVIDDTTTKQFIEKYIVWAKKIGFFAVRFRKVNGDLTPTPVESEFSEYKIKWQGSCPVCSSKKQTIKGMDVYWKSSVLEPTKAMTQLFKVVYQGDGELYADWGGKCNLKTWKPIEPKIRRIMTKDNPNKKEVAKSKATVSCGGSRSYSACGQSYTIPSSSSSCGGGSSSRC